ncbi:hypothetical protein M569_12891, partial [Genlisea aurea]
MGVCGSKPKACVKVGSGMGFSKRRRRKHNRGRRVKKAHSSRNVNRVEPSNLNHISSYTNPAFQVGNGESWYDPGSVIDSDDEFYSVQDDVSQCGSLSNVVTPRFANNGMLEPQPNPNDAKNSGKDEETSGALHIFGFNSLLPCLACDDRRITAVGASSMRKR